MNKFLCKRDLRAPDIKCNDQESKLKLKKIPKIKRNIQDHINKKENKSTQVIQSIQMEKQNNEKIINKNKENQMQSTVIKTNTKDACYILSNEIIKTTNDKNIRLPIIQIFNSTCEKHDTINYSILFFIMLHDQCYY